MDLIAHVQVRFRLVHDQHRRLLHQRPSNKDHLQLPARKLMARAPRKRGDAHALEQTFRTKVVVLRRRSSESNVRRAPHDHKIEHGMAEHHAASLRDVADFLPKISRRHVAYRPIAKKELPFRRREKPHKATQKRRLPHAVRTQDRQNAASRNFERNILEQRASARIAKRHRFSPNHSKHPRFAARGPRRTALPR